MELVQVGWRLDRDIVQEIQRLAAQEERAISVVVRRLLRQALSHRDPSSPNGPPLRAYMSNNINPPPLTSSSTLSVEEVAPPGPVVVEVMPPRRTRAARGSRLPEGWVPSDEGVDLCRSRGLDPQETLDRFRDYWAAMPGVKGSKLDWEATWRNWCRNERARPRAASPLLNGLEGTYDD